MKRNIAFHVTSYSLISLGLRNRSSSYPIGFWNRSSCDAFAFSPMLPRTSNYRIVTTIPYAVWNRCSHIRLDYKQYKHAWIVAATLRRWDAVLCRLLQDRIVDVWIHWCVSDRWRVEWIDGHVGLDGLMHGSFEYRKFPAYRRLAGYVSSHVVGNTRSQQSCLDSRSNLILFGKTSSQLFGLKRISQRRLYAIMLHIFMTAHIIFASLSDCPFLSIAYLFARKLIPCSLFKSSWIS